MKELIIIVALPAAGKTTLVKEYEAKGFTVLSRDIEGGSMNGLLIKFVEKLNAGYDKLLLDNTNLTIAVRAEFIKEAKARGFFITAIYLDTSMEDASVNAVTRMMIRHKKLFRTPEDYKTIKDPNMFPVAALFKARKEIQKPTKVEGFDEIITVKFKRNHNGYTNKAVLLDYDDTLRKTKSGAFYPVDVNDIEILPGRKEKLTQLVKDGYLLLGVSNQSGVAKGHLTYERAKECFDKTNELLGFDIDVSFCPHSVPTIVCYCRKPGVGHGVEFIEKYKLDPVQCIMVGDMKTDETFAKRCGFKYVPAEEFFR
jgi:HAD superfamily hydrolase (TIGR01662 family)